MSVDAFEGDPPTDDARGAAVSSKTPVTRRGKQGASANGELLDGMAACLANVPVGASATVVEVGCQRPVARRLMEMGVLPGTRVEVVRIAPLGDPIVLRLRGYALSIRRSEAAAITVEPLVGGA